MRLDDHLASDGVLTDNGAKMDTEKCHMKLRQWIFSVGLT